MRSPIHFLAILMHAAVLMLTALMLLQSTLVWPWDAVAAGIASAPLLLACPGLLAMRRYTLQWLSIALVLYISLTVMEVVATGAGLVPTLAFLAGLAELSLVFVLIRQARRSPTPPGHAAASE